MVLGAALLAAAVPAPENAKVHEQMTPEEIRQVFQTEPDAGTFICLFTLLNNDWIRLQDDRLPYRQCI